MLDECSALLAACARDAPYEDYAAAVVVTNVLGKSTLATRKKSLRHLRELYSLRADVPVFAGLRSLWWDDAVSRPLLAVLCAVSRDPLLRATADVVLDAPVGTRLGASDLANAIDEAFPHRFADGVRARIGRNVASSWTQSGHLGGRTNKIRTQARATPAAAAYALYLGHLADETGSALFRTLWARLLDVPEGSVRELAAGASRLGWITYRSAAAMTEVTFRHLASTSAASSEVFV